MEWNKIKQKIAPPLESGAVQKVISHPPTGSNNTNMGHANITPNTPEPNDNWLNTPLGYLLVLSLVYFIGRCLWSILLHF